MIDTGSVTIGWGEDGDEGVRKEDRIVHIVSGCGEIVLVGGKTGEDEERTEPHRKEYAAELLKCFPDRR